MIFTKCYLKYSFSSNINVYLLKLVAPYQHSWIFWVKGKNCFEHNKGQFCECHPHW